MKSMLRVLSGDVLDVPPVWLMRQAGRYLPEYRAVRKQAGSFLDLVYDPIRAAEVTMQPVRRFGFDAAILFSDILVVPQGMGVDLDFTAGEGPKLKPVRERNDVSKLVIENENLWLRVFETVLRTRDVMKQEGFDDTTTLIGFAGGPWTIACYMVQGSGVDHDFNLVRKKAFSDPEFFDELIDKITTATIVYLCGQIQAGAEVIQIFDSWVGVAGGGLFDRYVVKPTRKIVDALSTKFPDIPVIGFARGAGNRIKVYADQTKVTGIGCDYTSDLLSVRMNVGKKIPTQGNLDPVVLLADGWACQNEIEKILEQTRGTPHIFNLGHGVLPETPVQHIEELIRIVRQ